MHVGANSTPFDFEIQSEGAQTVTQNGLDRTAVKPDPRQDLSKDIIDADRGPETEFSIGAFEFITAVAGAVIEPPRLHSFAVTRAASY